MSDGIRARVSLWIDCEPGRVYDAFVRPDSLAAFWLRAAEAPLAVGREIRWSFQVDGAEIDTTATRLEPGKAIEWVWSDGSHVSISLEAIAGGTAVTLINDHLGRNGTDPVSAALDATEGFALVLADLKTWIETGTSAGITRAKAKLIELRS
jgi:uncharacterized protein YndB with AHSA1/START domain